jgi:hypothetical protein
MTQLEACRQSAGGCPGTNITPENGWALLSWYLRSHVHTWQSSLDTTTDMNWHT